MGQEYFILNFPLCPPLGEEATWSLQSSALKYLRPFKVGRLPTERPHGRNSISFFFFLLEISKEASKTSRRKRPGKRPRTARKTTHGEDGAPWVSGCSQQVPTVRAELSKPGFHCPKEPFGYFIFSPQPSHASLRLLVYRHARSVCGVDHLFPS